MNGMVLIMIVVCACVGEIDSTEWKLFVARNIPMLSLLPSYVCRGSFPKHFECIGRILVVKIWQPTMLVKVCILSIDNIQLHIMLLLPAFSKIPSNISN